MPWAGTTVLAVEARSTTTIENDTKTTVSISHPYARAETTWADGNGALQFNKGWANTTAFNTTGTTYDLTALTGGTGATALAAVKVIKIKNNSTVDTLVVGNAASVPFVPGFSANTTTVTIQPGAEWVQTNPTAAGWVCTTQKNLKLAASANTVNTTVVLLGI
jgi:hypothetical protein